ncbi:MAG: hypothetical protein P4M09_30505 [Devosia sp.]|nr:hypothetical protein [Devosia sp.]
MGDGHGSDSNVVSLAAARRRQQQSAGPVGEADAPAAGAGCAKEIVLLVTGGRFECMVNGVTGVLRGGDFLRVPAAASYVLRDVGEVRGAVVTYRFPAGLDGRFYHELAAALPPYATSFPRRGSKTFTEIEAIARRFGIVLDSGAAA